MTESQYAGMDGTPYPPAPPPPSPKPGTEPIDTFKGGNALLVNCIRSLLNLDAAGALVPHGIGAHARDLLSAAAVRLAAPSAAIAARGQGGSQAEMLDKIVREFEAMPREQQDRELKAAGESELGRLLEPLFASSRTEPPAVDAGEKCGCEICGGTRGGVPGNENRIDGKLVCDNCHADQMRASRPEAPPASASPATVAQPVADRDALMKLSQFAHTAAHMSESDMRNNLSSIADQLIALASRGEAPAASAAPQGYAEWIKTAPADKRSFSDYVAAVKPSGFTDAGLSRLAAAVKGGAA